MTAIIMSFRQRAPGSANESVTSRNRSIPHHAGHNIALSPLSVAMPAICRLARAIRRWQRERRLAATYRRLDDRTLSDIGINRGEISFAVRSHFASLWEA